MLNRPTFLPAAPTRQVPGVRAVNRPSRRLLSLFAAMIVAVLGISFGAVTPASATVYQTQLLRGQTMWPGDSISRVVFGTARVTLTMQTDGNLVLRGVGAACWASWTQGHPGAYAVYQSDGNFVIYPREVHYALWSSRTAGTFAGTVSINDNGDLWVGYARRLATSCV